MRLDRFRAFRTLAVPAVVLLGVANVGCPGGEGSSAADNTGGGGGNGGAGSGAAGAAGGNGAEGGGEPACTPETEICDKKDNDCDGEIDEPADLPDGCACHVGDQQPCYTGPPGRAGVGACAFGVQVCEPGGWGACTGEVVPQAEECNLQDDDCNGTVDDMGTSSCGVGACAATVDKCIDGQLQTCHPGQPSAEVCDGIDNDCNQLTDESDPKLGADCNTGDPGICAPGKWECGDRALVCWPEAVPTEETCDGLDNDCDGTADNGLPDTGVTCDTGQLGVCAPGTVRCGLSGGDWVIDCFSDVEASPEICDGLDNDCDGLEDQDDPGGGGACDTGQLGVCATGTFHCIDGEVECTQDLFASNEFCNGLDDNCDGQADEGDPGAGEPCGCGYAGIGSCENGALQCTGGPTVYFQEDFSDNSAGWTLGPTWEIGPALPCFACEEGFPDPEEDHSPTDDNGLAGVIIGGPAPTNLHGFYWLESPPFDTSGAPGEVHLTFWRWLNSDYIDYMQNKVQVFNGFTWVDLPYGTTGESPGVRDDSWQNHGVLPGAPLQPTASDEYPTQFNLTPYKNANMRIRFGYRIASSGVYVIGSWSIDDVIVAGEVCP